MQTFAVIAPAASQTNTRLGLVLPPSQALVRLRPGDVALGRFDVLSSIDGIERGLWSLDVLERRGVTVLNRRRTLALAHDKLATAGALAAAGVPPPPPTPLAPPPPP